ncbi:PAS domain S-box protein [Brevundimonas sp.]
MTRLARIPALAWWQSVLVGLGCAAVMLGVRQGLSQFYGDIAGFMLLLPAVIVAALAAGRIAGLTAVVAGLVGGWIILNVNLSGDRLVEQLARVATVNFILVGLFVAMVASSLRKVVKTLDATGDTLRESEQRFRLMANTAPSPVWTTDTEARVEFVNAALEEFYGRPADQILGHVWKAAIHPDDQATVEAAMAEARPQRQPYGFEARFQHAQGDWRWMRVSVNPRFDGKGSFLGYVGMSFDISDTRHAIAALGEQERRQTFLLSLADALRDLPSPEAIMSQVEQSLGTELGVDRVGYAEVDTDAGTVFMTRDWTSGLASAEGEFAVTEVGADLISDLAEGRLIRIENIENDPRTRDALELFGRLQTRALMRAPVIRAGQLRAYLYVHEAEPRSWSDHEAELLQEVASRTWTEIERSRAEAALRESESRFRAIADTAPVLIWVTQKDRVRAFVNQAYVSWHGGSYEEARLADWRQMVHPDDHAHIRDESIQGEAAGEPFTLEARYRRADGAWRWLRSFSRPRLDANNEIIGFVGVAFDITEARQAEDDLRRINELLEERVNQALTQKAKAEADLVHAQRLETVGRLTGGVAHDFNNLLTVVIGALDIILRSPDDAAKRKKLGEAALAAARRGEGLTHQLLAFSRRQTLRPRPVDLNDQILECEPLLRQAVGDTVELRLRLRRDGAPVNVDVAQFEAALLNLVVNARHAVKDGGRIGIQTQACEVQAGDVVDLPAGPYVCVTVSDNGSGMDADVLARVFEPFFTTKSVGKGTGLGLSQVYGFARQSGGAARVSSRSGQGTRIKLYLPPLAEGLSIAEPVGTAAAPAKVTNRKLLLVEDDPSVAAIALELLIETGFSVTTADNATQALDRLAVETFDVMLSDVVMPGGMTGIELARVVATDHPDMRIVLTSGYAGDDVDAALKGTMWPFLRKPYSGEELTRILSGSEDATPT